MNIQILYATYSGSTEAAARILTDALTQKGHTVTLTPLSSTSAILGDYSIFCTPTWNVEGNDGQPHEDYFPFMETVKGQQWEGKKFAILGLGDSSYPRFCGSVDVLESFVHSMKGNLPVPSLRIDGFFFDQETNTKKIIAWAQLFS